MLMLFLILFRYFCAHRSTAHVRSRGHPMSFMLKVYCVPDTALISLLPLHWYNYYAKKTSSFQESKIKKRSVSKRDEIKDCNWSKSWNMCSNSLHSGNSQLVWQQEDNWLHVADKNANRKLLKNGKKHRCPSIHCKSPYLSTGIFQAKWEMWAGKKSMKKMDWLPYNLHSPKGSSNRGCRSWHPIGSCPTGAYAEQIFNKRKQTKCLETLNIEIWSQNLL